MTRSMTDFYTLLKQSLIEREVRDAADREAVYAQARQAIVKQLWAFRPPLAADEIDNRVGAYDEAVERIESELHAAFASDIDGAADHPSSDGYYDEDAVDAEASPTEIVAEIVEDATIDAPPLAEWRHADEDDLYSQEHDPQDAENEEPDAITSLPAPLALPARAVEDDEPSHHLNLRARWDAMRERMARPSSAHRLEAGHEESDGWLEAEESTADAAHPKHDRWTRSGDIVSDRPWWNPDFGERRMVQVLAGAISALTIVLVAFGGYLLLSRDPGNAQAVALDNSVRREVSDAATASRIANEQMEVLQSYSLFDGRDPTIFATTPDNPIHYVSTGGGSARVSTSVSSPGVRAIIGPGLADRLAGQRVRVTLLARSSTDFGASSMRFAYQSGLAISHWQTASLSADYQPVAIIWRVPAMRTNPAGDYLLIEPGIPGDGTGVDIQEIKIDVLPPEAS